MDGAENTGFQRRNDGFSLVELLLAVSIIVILCAVSAPGVQAVRRGALQAALDKNAELMYTALTRNLKNVETSGNQAFLISLSPDENKAVIGERTGYVLTNQSDKKLLNLLLPAGSVSAEYYGGNWLALYDPGILNEKKKVSGADATYTTYTSESPFIICVYYAENPDRDPVEQDPVGFYGSGEGAVERVVKEEDTAEIEIRSVKVDNGEELTVTMEYEVPKTTRYRTYGVTISLTLTDPYDREDPCTLTKNEVLYYTGQPLYTEVLDSLTEGRQFKDVAKGLTPGKNYLLTLSVKCGDHQDDGVSSDSVLVNSLFGSNISGKVEVSRARHLQNLNQTYSGWTPNGGVTVKQTADIDWEKSWKTLTFQPVENQYLTEYDGSGHSISNLNASGGLFGELCDGTHLNGIRLVNPQIQGTENTGGIADEITGNGVEISNCSVFTDSAHPIRGTDYAGGLVGAITGNDTKIINSWADCYLSGKNVGGLVGMGKCTFENCVSAGFLIGESSGKLSGFINGTATLSGKCYSLFNFDDASQFGESVPRVGDDGVTVSGYPPVPLVRTAWGIAETVDGGPGYFCYGGAQEKGTARYSRAAAMFDDSWYPFQAGNYAKYAPFDGWQGDWVERPVSWFTFYDTTPSAEVVPNNAWTLLYDFANDSNGSKIREEAAKLNPAPKGGCTFKGWYLAEVSDSIVRYDGAPTFSAYLDAGHVLDGGTFYAKWEHIPYSLTIRHGHDDSQVVLNYTIDADDEKNLAVSSVTFDNAALKILSDSLQSGWGDYDFIGWSVDGADTIKKMDSTCLKEMNEGKLQSLLESLVIAPGDWTAGPTERTITAQWRFNAYRLTIQHGHDDSQNVTLTFKMDADNRSVSAVTFDDSGALETLSNSLQNGWDDFDFVGWSVDEVYTSITKMDSTCLENMNASGLQFLLDFLGVAPGNWSEDAAERTITARWSTIAYSEAELDPTETADDTTFLIRADVDKEEKKKSNHGEYVYVNHEDGEDVISHTEDLESKPVNHYYAEQAAGGNTLTLQEGEGELQAVRKSSLAIRNEQFLFTVRNDSEYGTQLCYEGRYLEHTLDEYDEHKYYQVNKDKSYYPCISFGGSEASLKVMKWTEIKDVAATYIVKIAEIETKDKNGDTSTGYSKDKDSGDQYYMQFKGGKLSVDHCHDHNASRLTFYREVTVYDVPGERMFRDG